MNCIIPEFVYIVQHQMQQTIWEQYLPALFLTLKFSLTQLHRYILFVYGEILGLKNEINL